MRTTLDFSPLFRSSIGFDRLFELLESATEGEAFDSWPPYDITKSGEDDYRIAMAVAGFTPDQLTITHQPNLLVISGSRPEEQDREYLYRGITGRSFTRRFELADHVRVKGASLENGLLTIDLVRELPEEMKPRRVEIRRASPEPRQIEAPKHAA